MCIPSFSSRMVNRRRTGSSSPHPLFSHLWFRGATRDQPAVRRPPQNTGNFKGACCVIYAASASSLLAFVFVSIFLRADGATTRNLSLITPVEPFRPRLNGLWPYLIIPCPSLKIPLPNPKRNKHRLKLRLKAAVLSLNLDLTLTFSPALHRPFYRPF